MAGQNGETNVTLTWNKQKKKHVFSTNKNEFIPFPLENHGQVNIHEQTYEE
jgi:hypothetical protein